MTLERLAGNDPNVPCDECATRVPAGWRLNTHRVYVQLCAHHVRLLFALTTEALMQSREVR